METIHIFCFDILSPTLVNVERYNGHAYENICVMDTCWVELSMLRDIYIYIYIRNIPKRTHIIPVSLSVVVIRRFHLYFRIIYSITPEGHGWTNHTNSSKVVDTIKRKKNKAKETHEIFVCEKHLILIRCAKHDLVMWSEYSGGKGGGGLYTTHADGLAT